MPEEDDFDAHCHLKMIKPDVNRHRKIDFKGPGAKSRFFIYDNSDPPIHQRASSSWTNPFCLSTRKNHAQMSRGRILTRWITVAGVYLLD